MDSAIILLFAIVIVVGAVLFAFITLGKRGGRIDVEKYRVRWLSIEQSLMKGNEASYQMAILNADKLVDQALRDKGYGGKTMGERLKSAKGKIENLEPLWTAHKLRNRIAHEPDFRVSYENARKALAIFKRTLKDLGAI